MKPIRVVLADDHTLLRAGIRSLIEEMSGIKVIAEAADAESALAVVRAERPDILLTDIAMPGIGGLELAAQVARDHPRTKVIILSMHNDDEYVRRALIAGISGYLLKDSDTEELGLALRAVARGENYLSPGVSKPIIDDYRKYAASAAGTPGNLSARQREVLQLIAQGMTTKAIATKLKISTKTVEWHRSSMMERLGVHDVVSLVRYAIRAGIVDPEN
jgi:DNA-binding NarL/FixJ family response regulator